MNERRDAAKLLVSELRTAIMLISDSLTGKWETKEKRLRRRKGMKNLISAANDLSAILQPEILSMLFEHPWIAEKRPENLNAAVERLYKPNRTAAKS